MTVQIGAHRVSREQVRKIWIKELQEAGIHHNEKGKQIHLLSYYEVRSLKVMDEVRREI